MRIKGAASWGWNEAGLWVLRLLEGLPDTGSNPAQMDIGVSYNSRVHREDYIECVSGVSRPRRGVTNFMKKIVKVNYRKVCGRYLQDKLSQGM
jgi:hypothetical protein